MSEVQCPTDNLLSKYVLGELHLQEADDVENHLAQCDRCAERADTIYPVDDITAAFASRSDRANVDETVQKLIHHLQKTSRRNLAAAETETIASDASLNDTGFGDVPAVDVISGLQPPERNDEIGRLGGYRILKILGAGGMGLVLHAEDPVVEREIAIKVMKPEMATPAAKERFLREARCAASIDHKNIVKIYEVGQDQGVPFMVMPLLKGESLDDRLKRLKKLDQDEVLRIGKQAASGLAAAHERGLIHRDVKPDNLWLDAAGDRVKILDFGLARTDDEDAGLTRTGMVLGTPKYMSPEQAAGETVDHRSDLFSLGSVLYRLATGEVPFPGKSLPAVLIAVTSATPIPVKEHTPDIVPELADLIFKLLSKNPSDRPQTASDVAGLIDGIQKSRATTVTAPVPQRKPRQKITRSIAGLVFCALAGTIAWHLLSRSDTTISALSDSDKLLSQEWRWTIPSKLSSMINTSGLEVSPEISADGLELLFTRECNLHVARRATVTGNFERIEVLKSLNSDKCEAAASMSEDRLVIVFESEREGYSLWQATRKSSDTEFEDAREIWPDIRRQGFTLQTPYLTKDGLALYLTMNGDLAVSRRSTVDTPFPEPEKLGNNVNSDEWESHPTLTSDESVLIFRSHRAGGFGEGDLWMSVRTDGERFGDPINLGGEINTPKLESGPSLSSDGETLYFMSDRGNSTRLDFDLWSSRRVIKSSGSDSAVAFMQSGVSERVHGEADGSIQDGISQARNAFERGLVPLDAAIEASPNKDSVYAARARYFGRYGKWRECAADYLDAVKRKPGYPTHWAYAVGPLVLANDEEGYQQLCRGIIDQFKDSDSTVVLDHVWKVCLIKPGVVEIDELPPQIKSRHQSELEDGKLARLHVLFRGNLAMFALRSGDAEQAVELTDSIVHPISSKSSYAFAVRTLSLIAVGEHEAAGELLEELWATIPVQLRQLRKGEATELPIDASCLHQNWVFCLILCEEAERLLSEISRGEREAGQSTGVSTL